MIFWGCFNIRGTEQLIAMREIMKFEDYMKIQNENLQLSAQNLDQSEQFNFQPDNDPKDTSRLVTAWIQKNDSYSPAMAFNES